MHIIVYINFVTHHPCQVAIISGGFLSLGRAVSACYLYLAGTIGVFQTVSPSVRFRIYQDICHYGRKSEQRSVCESDSFFHPYVFILWFSDQNGGHYRVLYNVQRKQHSQLLWDLPSSELLFPFYFILYFWFVYS